MTTSRRGTGASIYHLQDLRQRIKEVYQAEGLSGVLRRIFRRLNPLHQTSSFTTADRANDLFNILRDPMFDFSKLDTRQAFKTHPTVSIVVPVYNGIDFVPDCVGSLLAYPASFPIEVIVIDNGSTDGTLEKLRQLAEKQSNLSIYANDTNVGFAQAINQGAALARGDYISICNSDIIATPGWLDRLVQAMRNDPDLAVVSPVTNYVGEGPQLDPQAAEVTPESANQYAQRVASRKEFIYIPDRLVFFCVLVRKLHFDLLGGISGVFGLGNYEDDDFCLRARVAGFKLGIDTGAFVFHYGSRTFKEQKIDHTQLMLQNELIYYNRLANIASQAVLTRNPVKKPLTAPRVSIILRTKDRPYALERALTSLANQTYADFEVIVINDGGQDPAPILQKFNDRLVIEPINHTKAVGRSAALNSGLEATRGQWVGYLDDDDILYPHHLELLLHTADRSQEPCIVYSETIKALVFTDEMQRELTVLMRSRFAPHKEFSLDELYVDNWIPIMSFLHPVQTRDCIGYYDTDLGIFEDWEYLIRLAKEYPFKSVHRPTCEYRFNFNPYVKDSTLSHRQHARELRERIYKKYPASSMEIEQKRLETLAASRQQIDDVTQIQQLKLDDRLVGLLTACRLGGFPIPDILRSNR